MTTSTKCAGLPAAVVALASMLCAAPLAAAPVAAAPVAPPSSAPTAWVGVRPTGAGGILLGMLDLGVGVRTDQGLAAVTGSVGPGVWLPSSPYLVGDVGGLFAGRLPPGPVDAFLGARLSFAVLAGLQGSAAPQPSGAAFFHLSLLQPGEGARFRFALEAGVGGWPHLVLPVVGLSFGASW